MSGNDGTDDFLKQDADQVQALLICEKSSRFDTIIKQLKKRDIKFYQVEDIQGLVSMLMGPQHIDIVYLNAGLSSGKAQIIPPLLIKAFNLETVVFADGYEKALLNKLNNIKCAHKISGQPSATGFYRAFQKIFNSMASAQSISAQKLSKTEVEKKDLAITIRGNMSSSLKRQVILQRSKRAQLLKGMGKNIGAEFSIFQEGISPSGKGIKDNDKESSKDLEKETEKIEHEERQLSQKEVDQLFGHVHESKLDVGDISDEMLDEIRQQVGDDDTHESLLEDHFDKEQILEKIEEESISRQMINHSDNPSDKAYLVLYSEAKEFKLILLYSEQGCEEEVLSGMAKISNKIFNKEDGHRIILKAPLFEWQEQYLDKLRERNFELVEVELDGKKYIHTQVNRESIIPEVRHINNEMTAIDFKYIPCDRKLSFHIYLYFEKNEKYYNYLKPGNVLSARQKDKFSMREELAFISRDEVNSFYLDYCRYILDQTVENKIIELDSSSF